VGLCPRIDPLPWTSSAAEFGEDRTTERLRFDPTVGASVSHADGNCNERASGSIRIVLADDDHVVRHGIRMLIDGEPGLKALDECDHERVNVGVIASPIGPGVEIRGA
jgi:hypothetical protein